MKEGDYSGFEDGFSRAGHGKAALSVNKPAYRCRRFGVRKIGKRKNMIERAYIHHKLKKCPFCDSYPLMHEIVYDTPSISMYWVNCENCSAEIKSPSETEDQAISKWNKRVPSQVHEITRDEYEVWKKNHYRDPICMIWEDDIYKTPFWVFKPEEVHEPAFLMGQLKLYNGKPD